MFIERLYMRFNHTSGSSAWWILFAVGIAMIVTWFVAILPWVDLFTGGYLGIGQFNRVLGTTMIVYGTLELSSEIATYYLVAVLLGIIVAKFGLLCAMVGRNYARGYLYRTGSSLGVFGRIWIRGTTSTNRTS